MASKQSTVDFILGQIDDAGPVSARKMFGEYGIYCSGTLVGLICDDRLFIKPTPGGRAFLGEDATEAPPYPGAKPHLLISGEIWDDGERLSKIVKLTQVELPVPSARKAGAAKSRRAPRR